MSVRLNVQPRETRAIPPERLRTVLGGTLARFGRSANVHRDFKSRIQARVGD